MKKAEQQERDRNALAKLGGIVGVAGGILLNRTLLLPIILANVESSSHMLYGAISGGVAGATGAIIGALTGKLVSSLLYRSSDDASEDDDRKAFTISPVIVFSVLGLIWLTLIVVAVVSVLLQRR